MKPYKEWNVAIIGAGTMGTCLAQHFAAYGCRTNLYNIRGAALKSAEQQIEINLQAQERLGSWTEEQSTATKGNLKYYTDLKEAIWDADLIIEAVPEVVETKQNVFDEMFRMAPETAVLCSNTSGLNIYEVLDLKEPERVLITHFFNPAHLMPLVEIVKGKETPAELAESMKNFLRTTGKKPVIINHAVQGFVFNRLIMAMELEAMHLVEEGVVDFKGIDEIITSTLGPRFIFEGVFTLIDHCGLDTEVLILKDLIPDLWKGSSVPFVIQDAANKGDHGLKTGKGFYDYSQQDVDELRSQRIINIMKSLEFQKTLE